MTGICSLGARFMWVYSEWLRPFISLVIAATLFHPCAVGETKPIPEAEFSKLLTKAGNGSLSAQAEAARAYASGRNGNTNYEEAARWYHRAADQGDPDSQTNLGVLYLL